MNKVMVEAASSLADAPSTTTVALGSIVSPFWLPGLSDISTYAATLMPILGVTWIGVQIVAKIIELRRKK